MKFFKFISELGDYFFKKRNIFLAKLFFNLCRINDYYKVIALIGITEIFEYKKKYDKAIRLLQKELNTYYDENLEFQLAYFYGLKGELVKAENIFEKIFNKNIILNDKKDSKLIANLINIYNLNKKYDMSIKIIENVIKNKEIGEKIVNYLFFNVGNTYLGIEKYDTAIKYYKSAINDYGYEKIGIFYNLAKCYYQKEDYDNSIYFLKVALKHTDIQNDIADIEYAIGCSYEAKREFKEAKHHFERSLDNGNRNAEKMIEELSVTE